MNYKIELAYNGSNYHGWAPQPNVLTIHNVIEKIIIDLFKVKPIINASGRTDAKVHAIKQVINIKMKDFDLDPISFMQAINSRLPYDIRMLNIKAVSDNFHARFSCLEKTYLYVINTNKVFDPIFANNFYQYNKNIDLNKIEKIKTQFIGTKNFLSFSTSQYDTNDCVRTISHIEIKKKDDYILMYFTGNGFLRSMIRMIVGCLLSFNEDRIDLKFIEDCFNNPTKGRAIFKAPACGLYLYNVIYDN